jgi:hypothetical protein
MNYAARTLKLLKLGVKVLARGAQQQACQQEAEMRKRQRNGAIEKHRRRI